MYRNPSYSEDQDWENANQSQRGNANNQQYEPYGNQNQGENYYQNQRYGQFQSYGQNRQNRQNQDYNFDFNQSARNRFPNNELRNSYRFENERNDFNNERNDAGFQQSFDRSFGPDYGYGHPGNSRTGGDYGRNQSDYGTAGTYGASRNAGSMGSYGGAQGYGSSSNGYSNVKWGSGHQGVQHQPHHSVYGAYRDKNSFAPGERASYDGSQRSGSQGADNTRGWTTPGRSGQSGSYQHITSDEDARYEIYDTALSQYNRGEYNNSTGNRPTTEPDIHSHQNYSPSEVYGSRQRGFRQGSGNDQDRHSGTSDIEYGQTGTPFESEVYPHNRYYDPQTGDAWNPGSEL